MNKQFLLALLSVALLTILSGTAAGYLAVAYGGEMTPALADYQQKLSDLFMAGAGAIIGLLGGRMSSADDKPP